MMLGELLPDYTIKAYTDNTYGIIKFVRGCGLLSLAKVDKALQTSNDEKLANNFSRARSMVKQYALCNHWDWFFTGTLNPEWYDRKKLDRFYSDLSQWIRDRRKAYGLTVQYLLVPEHHKDGSWHLHGLLSGIPEYALYKFRQYELPEWFRRQGVPHLFPQELVDGDFFDWWDYSEKFGFCSLGRIKNPVGTALYITKYVSKDLIGRAADLGKHLYFASRPLQKAVDVDDIYTYCPELDQYLTYKGDFCSTGMVFGEDWSFPFGFDGDYSQFGEKLRPMESEPEFQPAEVDPDFEQIEMEGYR